MMDAERWSAAWWIFTAVAWALMGVGAWLLWVEVSPWAVLALWLWTSGNNMEQGRQLRKSHDRHMQVFGAAVRLIRAERRASGAGR